MNQVEQSMLNKLFNEDCLEGMKRIPAGSVDMVLCDLPYGMTDCKWDSTIPLDKLWGEYHRVVRRNGVIALFGVQPFTTELIHSNLYDFKYCWYWVKNMATGSAYAKYQPMRRVEDICIFVNQRLLVGAAPLSEANKYLLAEREVSGLRRKEIDSLLGNSMASHYFSHGGQFSMPSAKDYAKLQSTGRFQMPLDELKKLDKKTAKVTYNPQGVRELERPITRKKKIPTGSIYHGGLDKLHTKTHTGYPSNVLKFSKDTAQSVRLHPTQKPVSLLEYLVKTYTNDGDTVLDNCMGSGSTAIACINTGRNYIGFEKDDFYYNVANERIVNHLDELSKGAGQ